jgi:DNA-binding transcriptional MocR family regulator
MITAIAPHTRIDNSIILNMAEIGVYGFAVYAAIKMHLNQTNGDCFPSYARIAKMTGINRSTVIDYVKRLRARDLVDPRHRFKEDGSYTSNQYNFQAPEKPGASKNQATGNSVPSKKIAPARETQTTGISVPSRSRPESPAVVASDTPASRSQPPEQSEENKKKRTITEIDLMPTEKQKICSHPRELIVLLPDDITICNHCYGLLDANFQLITKYCPAADIGRRHTEELPPERVAA